MVKTRKFQNVIMKTNNIGSSQHWASQCHECHNAGDDNAGYDNACINMNRLKEYIGLSRREVSI